MKTFIIAVVLALAASAASAQTTAGELLERCKNAPDVDPPNYPLGFCLGFVSASWASTVMLRSGVYCVPNGVSLGQVTRVVAKHLKEHPEILHREAYGEVLDSIRTAWPCPVKK